MIRLARRMPNEASVSDWLGTAATAARAAANRLDEIRSAREVEPEALSVVLAQLEQARSEIEAVQRDHAHFSSIVEAGEAWACEERRNPRRGLGRDDT